MIFNNLLLIIIVILKTIIISTIIVLNEGTAGENVSFSPYSRWKMQKMNYTLIQFNGLLIDVLILRR